MLLLLWRSERVSGWRKRLRTSWTMDWLYLSRRVFACNQWTWVRLLIDIQKIRSFSWEFTRWMNEFVSTLFNWWFVRAHLGNLSNASVWSPGFGRVCLGNLFSWKTGNAVIIKMISILIFFPSGNIGFRNKKKRLWFSDQLKKDRFGYQISYQNLSIDPAPAVNGVGCLLL